MRRTFYSQTDDNNDIDEIESESYCFSNSGHSQSFHSEGLSRSSSSSHKKSDGPSTRMHSTKSNSSGGIRRDNDGSLDKCLFISRDQQQQLVTLAGIIMIGVFLLFIIIVLLLLVYCNNKVKSKSSRKSETELSFSDSSFSAKVGQSESCSQEREKKELSEVFLTITIVAVFLHRCRFYWDQERLSIKAWLIFEQKTSSVMHGSRSSH